MDGNGRSRVGWWVAGIVVALFSLSFVFAQKPSGEAPAATPTPAAEPVPTEAFSDMSVDTDLAEGMYALVLSEYQSTGMRCEGTGELNFLFPDGGLEPTGVTVTMQGVRTQCYHPDYVPDLEFVRVLVDSNGQAMFQP